MEMRVHALDFLARCALLRRLDDRERARTRLEREPQLVGEHLHGLREIERAIRGIGRNMRKRAAALDIRIRQPGALVAEHERDIAMTHVFVRAFGERARRHLRRAVLAHARGQRDRPAHADERIGERIDDMRGREHVVGAGGHRDGFRLVLDIGHARRDEDEAREAHRLERARGRADIARMTGLDKDEARGREAAGRRGKIGVFQGAMCAECANPIC